MCAAVALLTPPQLHRTALPAGDAGIEEAVASRLYRAELAAAEAQAKLGDWCVQGACMQQAV